MTTSTLDLAASLRRWGIVRTPLVRLRRIEPPGVAIYAKCEWCQPTGSVKDRVAAAMVARATAEGVLRPGVRLVEASSGNTGIALARLAAVTGHPLTVVVPENVTEERIRLLEAFGADIVFSPADEGSNGAVRVAERIASEHGWVMLHQYENPANVAAHEQTTGPEIVEELDRVDAFVACLGTGGTLMGVGRALRRVWPEVRVVAAEPPVGETIAGLRTLADGYVPPIFDPDAIDGRLLVRLGDALAMLRRLVATEGLAAGPSSGAAVHAAVRVARRLDAGSVVVTILPDGLERYLSAGILDLDDERAGGLTLW